MYAVQAQRAGGPEVLEYVEVNDPTPGEGEVLVDVKATGMNFIDTYRRSGIYPMQFPHIPGTEGSGVISQVGDGVTNFQVGDRVAWHDSFGSYAQKVVTKADMLVPVPDDIDFDTAAAILLQGLTAHYLVTDSHRIESGQTALVHAAAGGVGLLLTQLITHMGGTVIGTVSTEEKAQLAREAGAQHVFLYGEGVDIAQTVRDLTDEEGVHVVYDGVGKDTFDASLDSLRVRGSLVVFGGASGQVPPFDVQRLNSAGGVFLSRPSLQWFVRTPEELRERSEVLFTGLKEGWLKFRVGATFPLDKAADAHRALEGRKTTGKVVLKA
ncbi:quinone oxidoreductase [uncultured Brevibacterium sp.]|uniref:quinone oxidoreductase family protein n=1 Tax=uncultured Brevibacterium sp. TaxID=189678 RepID=UPI0025DDD1EE|nr:quinone oxidoreductase [uncultured Brevibacterium sp.]